MVSIQASSYTILSPSEKVADWEAIIVVRSCSHSFPVRFDYILVFLSHRCMCILRL
jgi:hypothetical protein